MNKSVNVTLGMNVAGYLSGAKSAHRATLELASGQETLQQRIQMQEQAMTQLGGVMVGTGAIFATFVAASVKAAADFESSMSSVQSATLAPIETMGVLRDAALEAGQATSFTATEAAGGIEELGKAGLATADILSGGLSGALDLAAAGQLTVADAAEQTATTLSQFKLAGDQAVHVADLLAAGAGKAQGGVSDLGQALNQSGLVAAQMGLSVEETVGSLTAFAGAGLLGSDAGTSFRTMLMRLTNPTGEAADKLTELGIQTRTANGEFVGMSALAGQLQTGMKDLSPAARDAAMAIIFGQDAIRAANVLYAEGEAGIQDWITQVDDSGYAAEVAAARLNNLNGDVEELGGAWETAMIRIGSGATGPLREVVQTMTEVVNMVGDADPAMQGAFLAATALAGGVLLIGGAGLLIIPQIAATQAALVTLGVTAGSTSKALLSVATSPLVTGLLAVGLAVSTIGSELAEANLDAEEMSAALKNSTNNADLFAAAAQRSKGAFGDFVEWAVGADWDMQKGVEQLQDLSGTLDEISAKQGNTDWGTAEIRGAAMVLKDLGAELANLDAEQAKATFRAVAEESKLTAEQMVTLLDSMPEYRDALLEQSAGLGIVEGALDTHAEKLGLVQFALEDGEKPAKDYSDALSGQATNAEDASGAIEALADELRNYNSVLYDSLNAEMDYYEALDAATAAVAENGQTLDVTTEAGRNNKSTLMDMAQSARELAADIYETTNSTDQMRSSLDTTRQSFYDMALSMTGSATEAEELTNKLFGIPSEIENDIKTNAAAAASDVDGVTSSLNSVPSSVSSTITVTRKYIDDYTQANSQSYTNTSGQGPSFEPRYAAGGAVMGPGPKGKDSVLAWLAPGEHVLTAADVDRMGGQPAVYQMRDLLARSEPQGFEGGGDLLGGWGQVAAQSHVSYSSPSYAQSTSSTDNRQDHRTLNLNGAQFDEQRIERLFRKWSMEDASTGM